MEIPKLRLPYRPRPKPVSLEEMRRARERAISSGILTQIAENWDRRLREPDTNEKENGKES